MKLPNEAQYAQLKPLIRFCVCFLKLAMGIQNKTKTCKIIEVNHIQLCKTISKVQIHVCVCVCVMYVYIFFSYNMANVCWLEFLWFASIKYFLFKRIVRTYAYFIIFSLQPLSIRSLDGAKGRGVEENEVNGNEK